MAEQQLKKIIVDEKFEDDFIGLTSNLYTVASALDAIKDIALDTSASDEDISQKIDQIQALLIETHQMAEKNVDKGDQLANRLFTNKELSDKENNSKRDA